MPGKIRIEHITNSLYQMERWSRYLRLALYKMDPKTAVGDSDAKQFAAMGVIVPPPLADGCPPLQPECCDDDHKHHGKGKGKEKEKEKEKGRSKTRKSKPR